MLELAAALALVLQDPPRPESPSLFEYCQTTSERDIAAGGGGVDCGQPSQPLSGPVTLERCLTDREAGRHDDCRPLLTTEMELVPASLFTASIETPPARLAGWLGVVCGADRLMPGETTETCRAEKTSQHGRARAARLALAGRGGPPPVDEDDDLFSAFALAAALEPATPDCARTDPGFDEALACDQGEQRGVGQAGDEYEREADRCQRRESAWRDEDTGDSSSSYGVTCSWGSGDPELQRQNREMLDAMLRGDR